MDMTHRATEIGWFTPDVGSPTGTTAGPTHPGSRAWIGDERIAQALYEAQRVNKLISLPTSGIVRLRTLDEIAAMGPPGQDWSHVFKQLKAAGLLEEQTLGQVMARWASRAESRPPARQTLLARPRVVPSPAPSRTGP
jgi:hypothetical protein